MEDGAVAQKRGILLQRDGCLYHRNKTVSEMTDEEKEWWYFMCSVVYTKLGEGGSIAWRDIIKGTTKFKGKDDMPRLGNVNVSKISVSDEALGILIVKEHTSKILEAPSKNEDENVVEEDEDGDGGKKATRKNYLSLTGKESIEYFNALCHHIGNSRKTGIGREWDDWFCSEFCSRNNKGAGHDLEEQRPTKKPKVAKSFTIWDGGWSEGEEEETEVVAV